MPIYEVGESLGAHFGETAIQTGDMVDVSLPSGELIPVLIRIRHENGAWVLSEAVSKDELEPRLQLIEILAHES